MDPRGFPTTLPEFQRVFPDDAACARYLEHLRWPNGFTCSKMRDAGGAISVRQASICRLKVPRLPCQCVAHRNHGYEIQPHAVIGVVLGRIPCDDADARAI